MAAITTVITGATSGIGQETARALARKGHGLYLLVRDITKGNALAQQLIKETGNREINCISCDLSDLQSVAAAADTLKSKLFAVNVLINNAGGMFAERQLSKDGHEMTFAVNHLGHFTLTRILMPLLLKGQARIINVSSSAHRVGKDNFDDIDYNNGYSAIRAYGTAKLYNIYFTKSLAEKYGQQGITAFALHPGFVNTGFGADMGGFAKLLLTLSRPFMISPERGAQTSVYLATQPGLHGKSGQYFVRKHPSPVSLTARNEESSQKLWAISEILLQKAGLL